MTDTLTAAPIFTRGQAKAADEELYYAMLAAADSADRVARSVTSIHYTVGDSYRRQFDSRSGWKLTRDEAIKAAADMAATDSTYKGREAREALALLTAAEDKLDQADAEVLAADKWADHGRWNRFAIVPGGHIHQKFGCFTLRPTTDVRWAYKVSGDTVQDAIDTYGDALCSHCYPDAPVAQTLGKIETDANGHPLTKAQAQAIRDARQAEKDAKIAAKNAKRVFVPGTTTPVVDVEGREVSTEVALNRLILEAMDRRADSKHWGAEREERRTGKVLPTYGEWLPYALEALAAKRGVAVADLRAEYDKKLAKKLARG